MTTSHQRCANSRAPGHAHACVCDKVHVSGGHVVPAVQAQLGATAEVHVWGWLPRRMLPRGCLGHMEREPKRLQLRYVIVGQEHMEDIAVAEDDETSSSMQPSPRRRTAKSARPSIARTTSTSSGRSEGGP